MNSIENLYDSATELHSMIMDWWSQYDLLPDGFHGRVTADNQPIAEASKGLILGARLLWTYADSYRVTGKNEYMRKAEMLYRYLKNTFIDPVNGGAYYTVTWDGKPEDTSKVTYANAFLVYALSAYYRVSRDRDACRLAYEIYDFLECFAKEKEYGGYFEACTADGKPDTDKKVTNEKPEQVKTMNTSLHVLEAYTGLYRVTKRVEVRKSLEDMLNLFTGRIVNRETMHQFLFFDREWNPFDKRESFGHDIEAAWLMCEAAEVLENPKKTAEISQIACGMIDATIKKGLSQEGLLYTEWDPETGYRKGHYSWWEQNETVVGACQAWQLTGKAEYLKTAEEMMKLIISRFWDHEKGGYFPSLNPDLTPLENREKANMWTCPYHNVRMCLELIERIKGK